MAEFVLHDVDDRVWARAMVKSQLEGWPMRELLLSFLTAYADGTIAPSGPAPQTRAVERDGVLELRFACPQCTKTMVLDVMASVGFGQMGFYAVECPSCTRITDRALPGGIVNVRRG